jgi:hypothetical protein
MGIMDTAEKISDYINSKYVSSPVTGEMIMSAAGAYNVDSRLMMAIMEQDSRFGTVGLATSTLNPGNVGNDDSGNTRTYESWQAGVTAVAEWLNRHRITQGSETEITPEVTETPSEPETEKETPPETVEEGETEITPKPVTARGVVGKKIAIVSSRYN